MGDDDAVEATSVELTDHGLEASWAAEGTLDGWERQSEAGLVLGRNRAGKHRLEPGWKTACWVADGGMRSGGGKAMGWDRFLGQQASRWVACGIDLVYPPRCPICQCEPQHQAQGGDADRSVARTARSASWAAPVCGSCARELSADAERCLRCGEVGGPADGCRFCRQRPHGWRQIAVLSSYAGSSGLREAVLRAKRPAGDAVAAALASLIVSKHGDTFGAWGIGRVVPVPMHWWRRSFRGTSAAAELSKQIARLLGLPSTRALVRHRATRMQNELPIHDRTRNVEGAFRARRRLEGERILLVDDVVTTGATLSACCRALLAAGAATVDVAVVARADRNSADA